MLDTELAPRIAARVLLTAFLVMGLSAAGPAVPSPARGAIPPQGLTVLLAGDSVPLYLEDTLADVMDDELGWHLISAAVPACSIYGDALAWPNGEPKGDPERCPGLVAPLHASLVQQHDPDVVIWWDRLSTMPFLTEGGDFVQSGSDRFWELRAIGFQDTIGRLRAGGARIVFVATEPTGIAFKKRCAGSTRPSCVWNRFRVRHYSDVTQPLNRTMRQYAAAFPAEAVFISITDTVCRWNVSPCDDRMWNGELARPTGLIMRAEARCGRRGRSSLTCKQHCTARHLIALDGCRRSGVSSPPRSNRCSDERQFTVTKRFDEEVKVERDGGMPSGFEWRGRRYRVIDVIGRWRIEGRWWEDGRDREYWRVEARGGAVWDLYHDRQHDRWHVERLWD